MAEDYAASIATTGAVAIGGSTTGNIETTGDADWFAITLTAGISYRFDLQGSATLEYRTLWGGVSASLTCDFSQRESRQKEGNERLDARLGPSANCAPIRHLDLGDRPSSGVTSALGIILVPRG
jgi:hypothetical protein